MKLLNKLKFLLIIGLVTISASGCITLFSDVHTEHHHHANEDRINELEERLNNLEQFIEDSEDEDEGGEDEERRHMERKMHERRKEEERRRADSEEM